MLAKPLLFAFYVSYTGILSLFIHTTISLLVRLTLHFSVLEGLMESRFKPVNLHQERGRTESSLLAHVIVSNR